VRRLRACDVPGAGVRYAGSEIRVTEIPGSASSSPKSTAASPSCATEARIEANLRRAGHLRQAILTQASGGTVAQAKIKVA